MFFAAFYIDPVTELILGVKGKVVSVCHAMKPNGGMKIKLYKFLTLAVVSITLWQLCPWDLGTY